ncbi:rRNA-processing protein las1 [Malassezia cuniculi]|uniref:rRNA-processing protein las1 n=1 Tax=Malassezia cuniculi TaxID=948313 RepID=A0AAF0ERU8_9BASI|nr:rRNA-processing protein las1 [Malassezia cuniculi]
MRLARRTSLAGGLAELQHVHALLYSDNAADMAAGTAIISVWLNRGACPQAAEVAALLVEAVLADKSGASQIVVRGAYSMALVRFVNSVADSFQTGMYAQSIGSIAERVDMPQWLVQVRHAATHEELPSLLVCREATRLALEWLNAHYWQPSLAPMSGDDEREEHERRVEWATELAQLLHGYRSNARIIAKDRSMARKGGVPLEKAIEAYHESLSAEAERRVAFLQRRGAAAALGRAHDEARDSLGDVCVASVLLIAVAQLLLPGALIPLAKDTRSTDEAVEIWGPLLDALASKFASFMPLLLQALARTAACASRRSSAAHAGAWLLHLANSPHQVFPAAHGWDFGEGLPADAAAADASPAWPVPRRETQLAAMSARRAALLCALEEPSERTFAIAAQLADDDERGRVSELAALWKGSGAESTSSLDDLESRAMAISGLAPDAEQPQAVPPPPVPAAALPSGWQVASGWLPTPIGCLGGTVPPLALESL